MIYLSLSYKIICIKASINLITMMYYLSWTSYFGISLYYLPWAVSLFSRNIICLESFIFCIEWLYYLISFNINFYFAALWNYLFWWITILFPLGSLTILLHNLPWIIHFCIEWRYNLISFYINFCFAIIWNYKKWILKNFLPQIEPASQLSITHALSRKRQ